MTRKLVLGVSGEPGSFSEEAGQLYSKQAGIQSTLEFLVDMEGVLAAISSGRVDLGIFPVVNSLGGLVTMAFEAMGKYLFTWVGQFPLDVKQCLLVRPGINAKQIKQIVSHPQGLAQCQAYLSKNFPNAEQIHWQDTAKAARDLVEEQLDLHTGVIASKRAAEIYGLEVLAEGIQDSPVNITTFIVVKRSPT